MKRIFHREVNNPSEISGYGMLISLPKHLGGIVFETWNASIKSFWPTRRGNYYMTQIVSPLGYLRAYILHTPISYLLIVEADPPILGGVTFLDVVS